MRINVTQEHIDQGREAVEEKKVLYRGIGIPYACPVAQALNGSGFTAARATVLGLTVSVGDLRRTLHCPIEVAEWMNRFDDLQPVEPFSFDLDVEP